MRRRGEGTGGEASGPTSEAAGPASEAAAPASPSGEAGAVAGAGEDWALALSASLVVEAEAEAAAEAAADAAADAATEAAGACARAGTARDGGFGEGVRGGCGVCGSRGFGRVIAGEGGGWGVRERIKQGGARRCLWREGRLFLRRDGEVS